MLLDEASAQSALILPTTVAIIFEDYASRLRLEVGVPKVSFHHIANHASAFYYDLFWGVSYFELDTVRVEEESRVVSLAVLWTVDRWVFDIYVL